MLRLIENILKLDTTAMTARTTAMPREFDTWRVILGIFGPRVLKSQGLRKAARNHLYWQT